MKIFTFFIICIALNFPAVSATKIPAKAQGYINKYCIDCHDKDTEKGDLHLEFSSVNWSAPQERDFWEKILDVNHQGLMPPKKKKQ